MRPSPTRPLHGGKMKAEIEKILDDFIDQYEIELKEYKDIKAQATSSITALIIKWLESKKADILDHHEKYHKDCHRCIEIFACNQLITELVEDIK